MTVVRTRSAAAADTASPLFEDLLSDRWREGNNRRSVVAVDAHGRLLGHCRGIDNDFHPGSRTLVLEVAEEPHRHGTSWSAAADALLSAQVAVSTAPLHVKPQAHETELIELCARHGGVLVQLMPPWRYVVDAQLRQWAAEHRSTGDGSFAQPAGALRGEQMLDLYVEHYTAQHARWSPAAPAPQLRAENAPDFVPGSEGAFDPERSTVLLRDGRVAAQALLWPAQADGSVEVTLQSRPYEGPTAREDMEACLATVIDRSADDAVLLIDSHVSEELESAMMRDIPGPPPHSEDTWTAIVGIPVPGGAQPVAMPRRLVPQEAAVVFGTLLH